MSPVVCFYENDSVLWSDHYTRLECAYQNDATGFLKQIQIEYPNQMKVLQVNFDYLYPQTLPGVTTYDAAVTVYILNTHKIIPKHALSSSITSLDFHFIPAINKDHFIERVKTIKRDIEQGRYYQVNLTSHFNSHLSVSIDSYEVFKFYMNKFKAEYCAFLPRYNSEILCYSPELFLQKKAEQILTRPIKGTAGPHEEYRDLIKSEKEAAELSMIVDLLRNDLQSVCTEKVTVTAHRQELSLNYLTHTYSEIVGQTQMDLPQILEKMLPAGSISGCPKHESLIAINELESTRRHFYTGCIGWWQDQDFKLNLAIRSFLKHDKTLTYFSGCGIVYDSDPATEWQEFLGKAKHLELSHEYL